MISGKGLKLFKGGLNSETFCNLTPKDSDLELIFEIELLGEKLFEIYVRFISYLKCSNWR